MRGERERNICIFRPRRKGKGKEEEEPKIRRRRRSIISLLFPAPLLWDLPIPLSDCVIFCSALACFFHRLGNFRSTYTIALFPQINLFKATEKGKYLWPRFFCAESIEKYKISSGQPCLFSTDPRFPMKAKKKSGRWLIVAQGFLCIREKDKR